MSKIEQELRTQPEVWLRASELLPAVADQLPRLGERVAIVGCGTSLYMAEAAARWREASGHGETDAFAASEFPLGRRYDCCVAISRSGTTTEVIELLQQLTVPSLLLTADSSQPASSLATATISLPFADEESVVQTRFATGWLALWRSFLGHDIVAVAQAGRRALADALPPSVFSARQFVFLGRGAAVGIAAEAALKLREAAGCWSEAYASMEFRHGPISATGPHSLVWSLDGLGDELRADIAATGATIEESGRDPMVELIRVQRAAAELAAARGLDPDQPQHLSRSVILAAGPGRGSDGS